MPAGLMMTQLNLSIGPGGGDLAGSAATRSDPQKATSPHVLEFEKAVVHLERQIRELELQQSQKQVDYTKEIRQLRTNYTSLLRKTYDNLSAWETVQVARHPHRPLFKDLVELTCRDFRELHGDRRFGDDPAIRCGLARLGSNKVMLKRRFDAISAWPTRRAIAKRCAA